MIPPAELDILSQHVTRPLPPAPWRVPTEQSCAGHVLIAVARMIADHLDADYREAYVTLCDAPGAYACLLDSTHGWTALCEYVALSLGIDAEPLFPSIH